MLSPRPLFFFIFALAFLELSTGSKKGKSKSNGEYSSSSDALFPGVSFAPPNFLNPSEWQPDNKSFMAIDPNVAEFENTLLKGVKSSNTLSKVFDLSQSSGLEYARFVYNYGSYWLKQWGIKNPKPAAEFATRPVAQNFYNFPHNSVTRALGNVYGRFLKSVGVLNKSNAEELAKKLLKFLSDRADVNGVDDLQHQFLTIGEGFIFFLNSVVHMNPSKGYTLATIFGEGFLLEAIQYGPGDFCH